MGKYTKAAQAAGLTEECFERHLAEQERFRKAGRLPAIPGRLRDRRS